MELNVCLVKDCNSVSHCKGFCERHYRQILHHGKILNRTIYDPNEFIIEDDICWVILYNKKCEEVARAKFDTIYYEYISDSRLKWHLNVHGYATAIWYDEIGKQYQIYLHQAIIQLSEIELLYPYEIDHKDGNQLNCLGDNLRVCTHVENCRNLKLSKNNTSGQKGVTWDSYVTKWRAQINVNYKHIHLGYFDIIEEAAKAYNVAAIKYFGKFAQLNVI